jgi:hypothetical protein
VAVGLFELSHQVIEFAPTFFPSAVEAGSTLSPATRSSGNRTAIAPQIIGNKALTNRFGRARPIRVPPLVALCAKRVGEVTILAPRRGTPGAHYRG